MGALTQELLDGVLGIAVDAGGRILEVYDSADLGVTQKGDESPLTRADLAAHEHIVGQLKRLWPDIPVLSEEDADIPYETRRSWTRYWLVDPLDGTKEFIKRNGEFTVNIALVDAGVPVLGVVHAPALKLTYIAAQGLGAHRIEGTRRIPMKTRKTPSRPALVVSKSHRDDKLEAFLKHMPEHDAVSRGSSLKLCLVANGEADLYPRTGPTSEWDTAAGHCVAEQAGALVLSLPDLKPLRYNQKESLLNPEFLVIGDPDYGWERRLPQA